MKRLQHSVGLWQSLGHWGEVSKGEGGEQQHLYWTIPGTSILICPPQFSGYQSEFQFMRLEAKAPSECSVLLLRPHIPLQFWGSDSVARPQQSYSFPVL